MKTPPNVARLDQLVSRALDRAGYSGLGVTLVVAASGGPDSSALLHSLHRLSDRRQINLHVAHLHHDIRGEESDQDAQFVASLAQQLGLAVTIEKEDPLAYQREHRISSFEQVTRQMRYSFHLLPQSAKGVVFFTSTSSIRTPLVCLTVSVRFSYCRTSPCTGMYPNCSSKNPARVS